jgi:hypothetical protein
MTGIFSPLAWMLLAAGIIASVAAGVVSRRAAERGVRVPGRAVILSTIGGAASVAWLYVSTLSAVSASVMALAVFGAIGIAAVMRRSNTQPAESSSLPGGAGARLLWRISNAVNAKGRDRIKQEVEGSILGGADRVLSIALGMSRAKACVLAVTERQVLLFTLRAGRVKRQLLRADRAAVRTTFSRVWQKRLINLSANGVEHCVEFQMAERLKAEEVYRELTTS